jgi:hypothetical protein
MSKLIKLSVIIAYLVLSNMAFAKKVYETQNPPRELTT